MSCGCPSPPHPPPRPSPLPRTPPHARTISRGSDWGRVTRDRPPLLPAGPRGAKKFRRATPTSLARPPHPPAPCRYLVPPHTRDAFFQAFCDLRTNTPKDGAWLARHARALAPRTPLGWVAAAAAGLGVTSAAAALAATALAITALALYACLIVVAGGGLIAASAAGVLALALGFGSALAAGAAATAGAAYGTGTVISAGAAGIVGALLPGRERVDGARLAAPRAPALAASPISAMGTSVVMLTAEDEFFKNIVSVSLDAADGVHRRRNGSSSASDDVADAADGLASPAAAPSTPAGGSSGGATPLHAPRPPFGEGRASSPAELSPSVDVKAAAARIERTAGGGGGGAGYRPSPLVALN